MRLGTRQECVGSLPGVSGVCQDSTMEFARGRLRLVERLSGVAEKFTGITTRLWAKIKLRHRAGFGRCSGISPTFARRFTEGIRKLAGNTPGDHRKKTERLTAIMSEAVGLTGVQVEIRKVEGTTSAKISVGKPSVSDRCIATATA
ncbi:hypothetical protein B296_00043032 [Ensete ventricosum]|uniref:Uncharacterized protein n=1 Tax=Ensete ventricosum TaxID=4639 RepID=A0A426XKT9_ENSVE|nr:hypothetical protein B296_00043032 [Ensete ventricosum]